jgi:hypothetical protein
MATTQDTLRTFVQLEGADTYVRGLQNIGTAAEAAAAKQQRMAEVFRRASIVSASIGTGSAGIIGALVKEASAYETYRNKLEIATKSASKAAQVFDQAKVYANKTPFDTGAVVDAASRLEMYGMTAQKWLPLAGDMAGAMGRDITDAVEAIADAISGGGLERLKQFGVTGQQLKASGWTGSYQDVQGIESLKKALTSLIGDKFLGGAVRMSQTLAGQWSTLRGEVSNLAAGLGEELAPQLKGFVSQATQFVARLNGMSPATRAFIADALKVGTVGGAIGSVVFALKAMELQWKANKALATIATREQIAVLGQEAAAVRATTAAYNEKAAAMRAPGGGGAAPGTTVAPAGAGTTALGFAGWAGVGKFVADPIAGGLARWQAHDTSSGPLRSALDVYRFGAGVMLKGGGNPIAGVWEYQKALAGAHREKQQMEAEAAKQAAAKAAETSAPATMETIPQAESITAPMPATYEQAMPAAREAPDIRELVEQVRGAMEQAKQAKSQRHAERMSTAKARLEYADEVYGSESEETARARSALVELLNTEARQAAQLGNVQEAYELATAAAREMKREHEQLNATLTNGLRVGSAYAEYLRSIGRDKEAEQYERSALAKGTAQRASELFGAGDIEGGYRAAAQAETLARSGLKGSGGGRIGGRGGTPMAGRALTGALHPSTIRSAQQLAIQNNVHVEVRDEQGNMRRVSRFVQKETRRAGYYGVFAQ